MTVVIDFRTMREAALQGLLAQIREMERVKSKLASGGNSRMLVERIIKTLRAKAAKLSSPTRAQRRQCGTRASQ
jgi:hypothetical protein